LMLLGMAGMALAEDIAPVVGPGGQDRLAYLVNATAFEDEAATIPAKTISTTTPVWVKVPIYSGGSHSFNYLLSAIEHNNVLVGRTVGFTMDKNGTVLFSLANEFECTDCTLWFWAQDTNSSAEFFGKTQAFNWLSDKPNASLDSTLGMPQNSSTETDRFPITAALANLVDAILGLFR